MTRGDGTVEGLSIDYCTVRQDRRFCHGPRLSTDFA